MDNFDMQMPDEERKRQAWLALAMGSAGLLGAPKGREWQAVGQGLQQGLLSYGDAQNAYQQQQMQKMKMQDYLQGRQREQQQYDEQRALKSRYDTALSNSMTPGMPAMGPPTAQGEMQSPVAPQLDRQRYGQELEAIDPAKGLAYQQAISKPTDNLLDKFKPEHYTPQSLERFTQTRNPADLVPVAKPDASPVGKINPSDFTASSVAQFLSGGGKDYSVLQPIDKRPVSNVRITNVAETEENKSIGKARGELFANINQGGQKATARLTALSAIDSLMGDIETGPLTPAGNKFAALAQSFGVKIDPNLPRKEAAQAFMNQLTLESRSTADGGGMPGAMSDKDREFLLSMNPGMGQTTQGRKMLIEVQKRMARRQQQIAQWAREYRSLNNNTFDEGFQDFAAMKAERAPLFADLQGIGISQSTSPRETSGRIGGGAVSREINWRDLR